MSLKKVASWSNKQPSYVESSNIKFMQNVDTPASFIDVDHLKIHQGINIKGYDYWLDESMVSTGLGDINGDGYDDFIICQQSSSQGKFNSAAKSYVLLGNSNGFNNTHLNTLDSNQGFYLKSKATKGELIHVVDFLGDFNGDGLKDIIISNPYADNYRGITYIVFGNKTLSNINLDSLQSWQGIKIYGQYEGQYSGYDYRIMDANADGYPDILMSFSYFNEYQRNLKGFKIVYGCSNPIDIRLANSTHNFNITSNNKKAQFYLGGKTGDVNEDGNEDFSVKFYDNNQNEAKIFIIYGSQNISNIDLSNFSSSQGLVINCDTDFGDISEFMTIGDFNGNGYNDYVLSSSEAEDGAGAVYVIFGSKNMTNINLSDFTGKDGFKVIGEKESELGSYLDALGDVNGDGLNDFVVGAVCSNNCKGASYIIFGSFNSTSQLHLKNLEISQGVAIKMSSRSKSDSAFFGNEVHFAGDLNKDGYNDVIMSAPYTSKYDNGDMIGGSVYVFYGKKDNFSNVLINNFVSGNLDRIQTNYYEQASNLEDPMLILGPGGDVNKDGISDFIVRYNDNGNDTTYVIFGSNNKNSNDIDFYYGLSNRDSFTIKSVIDKGIQTSNYYGTYKAQIIGDINADGFQDIAITFGLSSFNAGNIFIIFGKGNLDNVDLDNFSRSDGFKIYGFKADYQGLSIDGGCDLNGDGNNDLLVGGSQSGSSSKGVVYVLYGKSDISDVDLGALSANQGFKILGKNNYDYFGTKVACLGDFNGDGNDDFIAFSSGYEQNSESTGAFYIVYGSIGFSSLDLSNFDSSQATLLIGNSYATNSYYISIGRAEDVNKDGFNDVLIGVANADNYAGKTYVIFGTNNLEHSTIDSLSSLQAITFQGENEDDQLGLSVIGLGDVNGDGSNDFAIGVPGKDISFKPYGGYDVGAVYIVYGGVSLSNFTLSTMRDNQGYYIIGDDQIGQRIYSLGDINGDALGDFSAGNKYQESYIFYGGSQNNSHIEYPTIAPSILSSQNTFSPTTSSTSASMTSKPSFIPSAAPTIYPSAIRSDAPSILLSDIPSLSPTLYPSQLPSVLPSVSPSQLPTIAPSIVLSALPSFLPSATLSISPTTSPTKPPSLNPTKTPTLKPSIEPSFKPSALPTRQPTFAPTYLQTQNPTFDKNNLPSNVINLSNNDLFNVESGLKYSVLEIGDFNNDGLRDYFVSGKTDHDEGPVVTVGNVVFSKSTSFVSNFNNDMDSGNIVKLTHSSISNFYPVVSGIGDYNLDGLSDIALCVYSIQTCYIVYGSSVIEDIYLPNLASSKGFKIQDSSQTYTPGYFSIFGGYVSGGFDFDGDNKSDFVITDYSYNNFQGRVYLILSKANLRSDIDLNLSSGQEGIIIFSGFVYNWIYKGYSGYTSVQAGHSAVSIGDYNGDGCDDIGISSLASIFVVYGSSDPSSFSLDAIPFNRGFTYTGNYGDTTLPSPTVKSIGDYNGDGFQDLAICHAIYHAEGLSVGVTEVTTKIILGNSLNNNNPTFEIPNACSSMPGVEIGSATKVYDVNGDGFEDFFISKTKLLPIASSKYFFPSGYYYLIFGKPSGSNNINLENFNSNQGVIFLDNNTYNVVDYLTSFQSLGSAVSLGDLNKDGYADFLFSSVSNAYLIYGRSNFTKGAISTPSMMPVSLATVFPTYHKTSSPLFKPTSQPSSLPTSKPSAELKLIYATNRIYAILSREVYVNSDHTNVLEEMNSNVNRIPEGWVSLLSSYEALGNVGSTMANWNFFAKSYKCLASDEVIVAFQGTDDPYDLISSDKDLALGLMPNYYSLAKNFVDYLIQNMNTKLSKISFTGHSLGGYLAQLMTATYNRPAVVFESPGAKKIIDTYFNDPNYGIIFSSSQIANKIHCFNAAPNLVNIASGENFANVTRLYPEYDSSAAIFTQQQHYMTAIMLQFKYSDTPRTYSEMKNYWQFSGAIHNWPFYEMSNVANLINLNSYLNDIFYHNYMQNPFYWELVWDESPNANSLLFRSTASRKAIIASGLLGSPAQTQDLSRMGVEIQGDNSGNKFFGGTNYADVMSGGNADDQYYPFSGMDKIYDTGGSNSYYFYTHNMQGITEIVDKNQNGKIKFVNIGCEISAAYQVNGEENIFAFFPQFDTSCNLAKYSSGLQDLLSPEVKSINHKNDLVLMKYSQGDLFILYNNKAFDDNTRDKILVKNFVNKNFDITLYSNHNKLIAVGSDLDDAFLCSNSQESMLAGLSGTNTFFIPVVSTRYDCSIIGTDTGKNIYKFYDESSASRKLIEGNIQSNKNIGAVNIFGLKLTDIIDLSGLKLENFSNLAYEKNVNGTLLNLPNGISIKLDQSETFLVSLDGNSFAFYNASEGSYNTDIESLGFNITSLKQDLSTAKSPYQYTIMPTAQPTTSPDNNDGDATNKSISTEMIIGIALGGAAFLAFAGYSLYAYCYGYWPFSSFSVVPDEIASTAAHKSDFGSAVELAGTVANNMENL